MSSAAAAAAAKRRREEEEEHMTPYTARDLDENWEFKILRSASGAFKDPAVMQRYLAEEVQAGWTLVEKFDNSRIRLKRPAAARQQDPNAPSTPTARGWGSPKSGSDCSSRGALSAASPCCSLLSSSSSKSERRMLWRRVSQSTSVQGDLGPKRVATEWRTCVLMHWLFQVRELCPKCDSESASRYPMSSRLRAA
jgi:hypothetical protein